LDRGGEYHRLGDERTSRADLSIVAATNRPESDLKHDFVARFLSRVRIPSLDERRADVPLLVRHLALEARLRDPSLARFFEDRRESPELRMDPGLAEALVRHRYTHDVRELERLLWTALSTSSGTFVAATDATRAALFARGAEADEATSKQSEVIAEPTREEVEAALARADGNVTQAARELRLGSRYALYRLMKKLGVRD
jgi:two-component system nitrogen regulation response regulator GlnG/two-component system response regulator HydG